MAMELDPISSRKVKVLLVDDDPSITQLGEVLLERESDRFEFETASNGEEALEKFKDDETDIDGIVSDFVMPGMNGMELLREVRVEDEDIPFFLYTGKGSEEIASISTGYNVDQYIQKSSGTSDWEIIGSQMLKKVKDVREKDMWESMLTYSNDITTVVSPEGRIVYTSPASERILGYEEGEQVGESVLDYVHPEDLEEVSEKMEELTEAENEKQVRAEFRYKTGDGEYVSLDAIASYQPEKFDGIIVNSREIEG